MTYPTQSAGASNRWGQNRLLRTTLALVIITLFSSACTTQRAWVYPAPPAVNDNQTTTAQTTTSQFKNATVAVIPFSDQRENLNYDNLGLSIVPGVPYVKANFQVPETANAHVNSKLWINFKPTEDFSKALASDLDATDIFAASYYSHEKNADYYVQGEILSTEYRGKIYTYGTSIYAPVLWGLGLPYGKVSNDLAIKLSLVNAKTGAIAFSESYSAPTYEKRSWIYNVHSDFEYSSMLKGVYQQFIEDLEVSAKM